MESLTFPQLVAHLHQELGANATSMSFPATELSTIHLGKVLLFIGTED